MKLGYRGRLFLVSLVLTLSVVAISGFYLNRLLKQWVEQQAHLELSRHALTSRIVIERIEGERSYARLDEVADLLGSATGMRVELFGEQGERLGDSTRSVAQLEQGSEERVAEVDVWRDKSSENQEIFAMSGQGDAMQRVLPWRRAQGAGFIRLSLPMSEIEALKARVRLLLWFAAALGLGAAVVMSGLGAHLMSSTLRELNEHVQRMARGGAIEAGSEVVAKGSITRLAEELSRKVEELVRERDRFSAVLESMDEGVLALDGQQRVRMMNRAAQQMFAPTLALFDQEEMNKQPVTTLIRVPVFLDLLEEAAKGKRSMAEFTLPGPPLRRVVAHVNPRSSGSGGVVLVLHDVTEIRKLETVRKDFVANVSHELRTPVSVIMLNAETLIEDAELLDSSVHARRFVEGIHRNAERLSRLISDLLDISKLEAGKFRLELEPVSVFGAALKVMDALEERALKKEQQLDTDIPLDLLVFADAKALDQMLVNLVDNAIKYAPQGGKIVVRARRGEMLESDEARPFVRLEVCDDGPGLPAKHRPRIFERFYRVDDGRSRDVGGTGLGLSIVKHFAEAMGGRVGVMPNAPCGSIFWIRLPMARQDDEVAIKVAQAVEVTTTGEEWDDPGA